MALSPYARLGQSQVNTTAATQRTHLWAGGDLMPTVAAYEQKTGYNSELWRQIAEANSIDDLDSIQIGSTIVIPFPAPSIT